MLAEFIIDKVCARFELPECTLSADAKDILLLYDWPGNVRQLENAITYAVNFAKNDIITKECLPKEIWSNTGVKPEAVLGEIKSMEHDVIMNVIKTSSSMEEAARRLSISRSTLYRKLAKK